MKNLTKLGKVVVFIDAANLELSAKDLGIKVSYRKLRAFFVKRGSLVFIGYYTAAFGNRRHRQFLKSLTARGYKVVTKPLKLIKSQDVARGDIRKANFDVEIAMDAMSLADKFETLVLFSGDSDFDYLVKNLKKRGKKVLIFSFRGHISKELARSADQYIPITKLDKDITRGT